MAQSNPSTATNAGTHIGTHIGTSAPDVVRLQSALVAIGAMRADVDGRYGPVTHAAVRLFQWYLTRMTVRLKTRPGLGARPLATGDIRPLKPVGALDGMAVDGIASEALIEQARLWQREKWVMTTPLVRQDMSVLGNIRLAAAFRHLDYPAAVVDEMLVHQDFAPRVVRIDEIAHRHGVTLLVNQAFRVREAEVEGAVVRPASTSQHLIGHALDVNIVDGKVVNTSAMFTAGRQTKGAMAFIDDVRKAGLRWGGDFDPPDPPHIDDFVHPDSLDYMASAQLAQNCFATRHPIRVL